MVEMSLEKRIRDKAEWICKHCSQVFDDFENARKHESIEKGQEHHILGYVEMLDVTFAIKEVAQQIREIFVEEEYLQLSREDYTRLKNQVLGLLVEEGDRKSE